jgi:hypothetical protein
VAKLKFIARRHFMNIIVGNQGVILDLFINLKIANTVNLCMYNYKIKLSFTSIIIGKNPAQKQPARKSLFFKKKK